jgi:hypothetical protein
MKLLMFRAGLQVSVLALVFLAGPTFQAAAMERWAALSQIESGDDDSAVGPAGEVSRYQIKPEVWRQHPSATQDWENPEHALAVAQQTMKERCAAFEQQFKRPPNDTEFYILWNAPGQIERPSKAVRDRAERFCNLLGKQ